MLTVLLDQINYDRMTAVLMYHDLYDLFLELVNVCQRSSFKSAGDELVSSMFVTILYRNDQAKMLHMVTLYESILL